MNECRIVANVVNESEVGLGHPGRDADLHLSVGDFIIVLSPPF